MAAGVGATAFALGTMPRADGTRRIDDLSKFTRTAGNFSPFQIGNTFRAPEWMSPFTSPEHQNLTRTPTGTFQMEIPREHLTNLSTYSYLKQLSGMDATQMAAAGLTPKLIGEEDKLASHLLFEKANQADINGQLYSVVQGEKHLLARTALLQFSGETASSGDILAKNEPVNKVAKSVAASMDMWGKGGWKTGSERALFTARKGKGKTAEVTRPGFIPIPAIEATGRGTTYLRAGGAFTMERFNQLITNVGEETLGKTFTTTAKKLGFGLGVNPGPASHMYGRFGMKAAAVLGAGVLLNESDWIRRQGGMLGQTAVSAGVSFGIGAVAARAGFGPKVGLFAGLASFAGQMILPGFDQGVLPGIASTWAMSTEVRASGLNPFNPYRRTVEGLFPGISGIEMGVASGLLLAGASYMKIPGSGQSLPNYLLDQVGHKAFGMAKRTSNQADVRAPKNIRDHAWDAILDWSEKNIANPEISKIRMESRRLGGYTSFGMRSKLTSIMAGSKYKPAEISQKVNELWAGAEETYKTLEKGNPVNQALKERLTDIDLRYAGRNDYLSQGMRQLEGVGEQVRHSFFGANVAEERMSKFMQQKGFKHAFGRAGMLFATGLMVQQLATGGLLGSMESSEELRDIYAGRQLVEVGKSRAWEMGGTPLGGNGSGQFRPHWLPTMMNRVRQKGVWGEDEDNINPLGKFALANFTNYLEEKNYYDRPYPISAPAFSNIPIIGGVLSSTIGQLVKPAQIMHANEWMQGSGGNLEFASVYQGWKREPAYNLGAAQPGIPVSPFSPTSVFSDMNAQFRDLGGLVGWASNTMSNLIVGQDTYFTDSPRLSDAGMMTSHRRHFWDMSLGGGGPFGEALRRVIQPFSNDQERINPLINSMPQWLPAELHWGDPYAEIPNGEAVLPGRGYEALHPELKGTDPEDYPLIYQYDILSQVSPKSANLRDTRDRIYRQRQAGLLSPDAEEWVDRIDRVVAKQWNVLDTTRVNDNAIELPGVSRLTQGAWFGAREQLRAMAAPVEYLVPGGFRPVQKLLGNDKDAIERYEYERMYGSGGLAFWDKPFRDFLRPSMYSLANLMGYEGKPAWRVEADATNKYFDELEFNKWMTLAQQAQMEGNTRRKIQYEYQAANTRTGVNPQGNPLSIYWSLPAEDRAYFNAFAFSEGKDRDRILDMIPSDQAHLYTTLWSRMDNEDPRLWAGLPTNPDEGYMYKQMAGMNQGDMPPPDWVGYNADVSLSDIKVRYVNELAKDYRDYGLWESQERDAYSQPFLEGSTGVIHSELGLARGGLTRRLTELFGGGDTDLHIFSSNANSGTVNLTYNDDRRGEIDAAVSNYMGRY